LPSAPAVSRFYRAVSGQDLQVESFGGSEIVVFKGDEEDVRGCLIRGERFAPGPGGAVIHLNAGAFTGGFDGALERIPAAGGSVVSGRTSIGLMGWIALFKNSEGNVVGLHQVA